MPWLFEIRIATALVVIAVVSTGQQPMFLKRAVNPDATASDVPQPVRVWYDAIDSKRSLLIPFCGFPDKDICPGAAFQQKYSLESLFSIAAGRTQVDVQTARKRWFQEATSAKSGQTAPFARSGLSLATMLRSFQLLAVINRMDLATWSPGTPGLPGRWSNSELRFIYAAKPVGSARFTLIVEFVLPDMEWKTFRTQAGRWSALAPTKVPLGSLEEALGDVIEQTGYRTGSKIRIRANCEASGGNWQFSQWEFRSPSHTLPGSFEQCSLDYQINPLFAQPTPVSGPLAPRDAEARFNTYSAFWKSAQTVNASPIPIPAEMSTKTALYARSDAGPFLSPPSDIPDSSQLRVRRNVIALQQCTGCHSRETSTHLQHVSESGYISRFLVPDRNVWNPSLEALAVDSPDQPSATWDVTVRYCVAGGSTAAPNDKNALDCPNGRLIVEKRRFHDLARRRLFMATLLAAPPDAPGPDDVRHIMDCAPDFAH